MVFDRPRLRAVAHAHIAEARVGAEGNEDDARALIHQTARKFGKFAVIADEDADRAAIGLDHVQRIAALDVPPESFVGGRVDLFLRVDRSIAQGDIGDVLDVAIVGARRVGAAYDVDIIFQRHARQFLRQTRCVAGELVYRFQWRQFLSFEGE